MASTLLDSITVCYGKQERKIVLCQGDVTAISGPEAVDWLAVSALPGDYAPLPGSVIAALDSRGVSVRELSKDKQADYRPDIPCWLSKPIMGQGYGRILVFEPPDPKKTACDQVAYIFSAIAFFSQGQSKDSKVALPLPCTGSGGVAHTDMLEALFFAATHWGAMKFPFKEIKIFIHSQSRVPEMKKLFSSLKSQYQNLETLNCSYEYSEVAKSVSARVDGMKVRSGDVLTRRQIFGVAMYTSSYYLTMHRILRSNDRTSQEYRDHRPLFEAADTALMNIAPYGKIVYRGESDRRVKSYTPGAEIQNLSYTSFASEQGYFYKSRKCRLDMDKALSGAFVAPYSCYTFEKEVLFGRGLIFIIKTAEKKEGYWHFKIREKEIKFRR